MERVNKILSSADFLDCIKAIETFESDRIFCKHGLNHLLDTARIAYILNLENGLNIPKGTIYATALLHDIGRYDEYYHGIPHNQAHDRIIHILQSCEYSQEETALIVDAIKLHRNTSSELVTLGDIISRADKLSRNCFNCKAIQECYWVDDKKNLKLFL